MSNKVSYAIVSVMFTLLLSCQKNDLFDNVDNNMNDKIAFTLYDTSISTRGTAREGSDVAIYNTDKVNVFVYSYDRSKTWTTNAPDEFSFYFRSKLNDLNNDLANSAWGYAPDEPQERFFPQAKRIACFAYASDLAPITGTGINENGLSISDYTAAVPIITYTVPTDVYKQPDLVVSERVCDRTTGSISLLMKHTLTRIGVSMLGKGQKVSNIVITGVANQGSVSLDVQGDIQWDLTGATYDDSYPFGLISNVVILDDKPSNPLQNDGYLMMLPQSLTDKAKLEFLLNDRPVSVSLKASGFPNWAPGKKITYLIDVSGY